MPANKMGKLCEDKAVLVSVYVESPRRRRVSSSNRLHHHHHHHHLHVHHSIKQEVTLHKHGDGGGTGYNRRADLLLYSQRLRESARSTESYPSEPEQISSDKQQHTTNDVAAPRKTKYSRTPTCLGNRKILIPAFSRSLTSLQAKKERKKKKHTGSTSNTMKAVMKSLDIQRKSGFILKLISKPRKHR